MASCAQAQGGKEKPLPQRKKEKAPEMPFYCGHTAGRDPIRMYEKKFDGRKKHHRYRSL